MSLYALGWIRFALAMLVIVTVSSCASKSGNPLESQDTLAQPGAQLLSPDVVRDALSSSESGATAHKGRSFLADLPHPRSAADDDSLLMSPEGQDISEAAYAYFELQVEASVMQDLDNWQGTALSSGWSTASEDGKCWFALANRQQNRWDWIEGETSTIDTQGPAITREHLDENGKVLIVVLVNGQQQARMDWLALGQLKSAPQPPKIRSVAPLGGIEDGTIHVAAEISGISQDFNWDFGAGATPASSTEVEVDLQLSAAGDYAGTLSVSSDFGSDSFDFDLHVLPAGNWLHTLVLPEEVQVDVIAAGPDGSMYMALRSTDFSLHIARYSSSGELLWCKFVESPSGQYCRCMRVLDDGRLKLVCVSFASHQRGSVFILNSDGTPFIASGQTFAFSNDIGHSDFLGPDGKVLQCSLNALTMTDADGTPLWSRELSFPGLSEADSVELWHACEADDGSIYVGAKLNAVVPGKLGVVRLDADGAALWARYVPANPLDKVPVKQMPLNAVPLTDGVALNVYEDLVNSQRSRIVCVDSNGNLTMQLAVELGNLNPGSVIGFQSGLCFGMGSLYFTTAQYDLDPADGNPGTYISAALGQVDLEGNLLDWELLSGNDRITGISGTLNNCALAPDGGLLLAGSASDANRCLVPATPTLATDQIELADATVQLDTLPVNNPDPIELVLQDITATQDLGAGGLAIRFSP